MKKVETIWAELKQWQKDILEKEGIELSQEKKVELALVDELKELASEAKRIIGLQEDGIKWGEKADKQFLEVKRVVSDAEGITRGAIKQAAKLKTESQPLFNKIEVSAKELGINPNDIKGYKNAIILVGEVFENQNGLNGWNDFLKKLL